MRYFEELEPGLQEFYFDFTEGVETEEQLALVPSEGCSEAQGYLLGRHRPVDRVWELFSGAAVR